MRLIVKRNALPSTPATHNEPDRSRAAAWS